MRKAVIGLAVVLVVLAGAWLLVGGEAAPSGAARAERSAQNVEVVEKREPAASDPSSSKAGSSGSAKPRPRSKAERDAMRERIVQAMKAHDRSAASAEGDDAGGSDAPPPGPRTTSTTKPPIPPPSDELEPTPGDLVDRTGDHGHLLDVMNNELMPLVDECYGLARETQPQLAGMLEVDVEMIGDEDIGGVVETVTTGQLNEIADEGLMECVRESLLSTTLPPPPHGGRDAISLSLRLEPDED